MTNNGGHFYPSAIWLISENDFNEFTCIGGRVLYFAEEGRPEIKQHPSVISADPLLPPIESIQLALDDRQAEADAVYEQYLMTLADAFISVIVGAAVQQAPIGLLFGYDELQNSFPTTFINFLFKYYGIVIGVKGQVEPYILQQMMPICLAKLYNANIIDYKTFMEKHPPFPIHDSVISKMAYEQNPVVPVKDFANYKKYFETIREAITESGKFLVDPFVSV